MTSICIFCGANFNGDPVLRESAEQLIEVMFTRNISLVFGGGKVGLMGLLADEMITRGGKTVGVIPQFLMDKEVGHTGLTELHIVDTMHQLDERQATVCSDPPRPPTAGVLTMRHPPPFQTSVSGCVHGLLP